MSSMKDVKQRIANVSTTKQIMNAMNMVASTRLRKARERLESALPFYKETRSAIEGLRGSEAVKDHIYVKRRKVKNTAYVIITSDKGLCGSYNLNVSEAALAHMEGKNEQLILVGSKGSEYFRRRGKNIRRRISDLSEARMYDDSCAMSDRIEALYVSGRVDEVYVAYTHFESTLNYIPRVERLLPVFDEADRPLGGNMGFEPDPGSFLDHAVPIYLHSYLYAAAAESVACEHASRMINMDSAGNNATEIIDELNREYNRKRQAAITQELSEIVNGANILN